jgi:hypothetical protein
MSNCSPFALQLLPVLNREAVFPNDPHFASRLGSIGKRSGRHIRVASVTYAIHREAREANGKCAASFLPALALLESGKGSGSGKSFYYSSHNGVPTAPCNLGGLTKFPDRRDQGPSPFISAECPHPHYLSPWDNFLPNTPAASIAESVQRRRPCVAQRWRLHHHHCAPGGRYPPFVRRHPFMPSDRRPRSHGFPQRGQQDLHHVYSH